MAGRLADHEERVVFYEKLSKQRPLEEHELDRLTYLVSRIKALKRERKYRETHAERIKQEQRDYLKTNKGKKKSHRNWKAAYDRDPKKFSERAKQWRIDNPEKYQAQLERKNEKRRAAKALALIQKEKESAV